MDSLWKILSHSMDDLAFSHDSDDDSLEHAHNGCDIETSQRLANTMS